MTSDEAPPLRRPSLLDALVPLAMLAVLIAGSLALSAVEESTKAALASVSSAIFILLAVGVLIGVWNLSGTDPTLVNYGIHILSPGWFYAAAALICGVVALSIGSSWTTAATIGVGLVGVAGLVGVSPAITAGALDSGAYLGDKTSPLSETTVLTSQMVGLDVNEHIKRQVWTSGPAFAIAFVVFFILGLTGTDNVSPAETTSDLDELNQILDITPFALLPLVLLGYLTLRKVPAYLALLASTLLVGVLGVFLQPDVYADFVAGTGNAVVESATAVWLAMANGFSISSGIPDVDRLLSRGGMEGMLLTIWLILGALTFGAMLEAFGLIARLVAPLLAMATSTGRLFLAVFLCGFGLNVVAGDRYIALVLPTRIFRVEFTRRGLAPANLSRLAADSGTVTSPLVPWNSCGGCMAATLGISTLQHAPYVAFCFASPLLSVLYGFTGLRIETADPSELGHVEETA